ncbi:MULTISPECIES: hypothetical protein [unclassified Vibrio]|uniref:hypothetical protein n=1 Tax=unclassified Vibrio TaxID=2614977 RepID=UPI001361C81F|nr:MULTISPECIES: hypothetical protein [unclassified Vibrio]NAW60062.1 hypothetical protein [Vibrio sp. V36_P2S2PM302]NAX25981.1 hypothetical protein [Vibrio sp. V38_P2S17PM301]NAX30659.1 hypothetical protein [Vibrio sp. V37_P2S8PM304]
MKKTALAACMRSDFKPQKNSDLLFTANVGEFFQSRHHSHICFADAAEGAEGGDTGGAEEGASDSVLGGDGDDNNNDNGHDKQDDKDDDQKKGEDGDDKDEKDDEDKDQGAPEAYELQLPEGMELDQELFDKFEPLFRDANLTNEQASKFASAFGEQLPVMMEQVQQDTIKSLTDTWTAKNQQWIEQLNSDSEFGGKDAKANFNVAKSVIDRFGGDEDGKKAIRSALNETGAGNHPEIMRLLYRVGKAMADDKLADLGESGGKGEVDLYPNSPNLK